MLGDPLAKAAVAAAPSGALNAPMPGRVAAVLVAAGQPVKKGAGSGGSNKSDEQKTDEAAEAIEDAVEGFVSDLVDELDDLFKLGAASAKGSA